MRNELCRRRTVGIFNRTFGPISALFLVVGAIVAQGAVKSPEEIRAWKHLKSVDIVGKDWSSGQTNYQIMIVCHKGVGQDAGADVYLGADVRDDFGDVRFRDASGDLSYWTEKHTVAKEATFWVNVPTIPAKGTIALSLVYGNPAAATTSDGKKTFRFFEDFTQECSKAAGTLPAGWELGLSAGGDNNWEAKDGVIRYHDDGHLNTIERIWPDPREEPYTLRSRAMWPDPPFKNKTENGESIGGLTWRTSYANAFMDVISLYQRHGKQSVSFGSYPRPAKIDHKEKTSYTNYVLKVFGEAYIGKFVTCEIERKADGTIARIIESGEEFRSERVIPDSMYVIIHPCSFNKPDSPPISVDWMLLRKQAYPNPSYGQWTSLK